MSLKLLKIKLLILFYSLTGKMGRLANQLHLPISVSSIRSILIFFPVSESSFQVALYSFRHLINHQSKDVKFSFMILDTFSELVNDTYDGLIFYKMDELKITPTDIKFDLVIDLNPEFHLELSKFISRINSEYKMGFKSIFSDYFYNIQLNIPPSGFLERGYKQVNKIIQLL